MKTIKHTVKVPVMFLRGIFHAFHLQVYERTIFLVSISINPFIGLIASGLFFQRVFPQKLVHQNLIRLLSNYRRLLLETGCQYNFRQNPFFA